MVTLFEVPAVTVAVTFMAAAPPDLVSVLAVPGVAKTSADEPLSAVSAVNQKK